MIHSGIIHAKSLFDETSLTDASVNDPQSSGARETRVLSKDLPLAIGRHSSNDIQVDEDGVAHAALPNQLGGKRISDRLRELDGRRGQQSAYVSVRLERRRFIKVGSLEMAFHEQAHAGIWMTFPWNRAGRTSWLSLPQLKLRR